MSTSYSTRAYVEVWFCDNCAYGPLHISVDVYCANCGHLRCSYCRVETVKTR
ncbi:hypothetical protein B0T21DRAFT_297271, partial [Apiosordaria backusii]